MSENARQNIITFEPQFKNVLWGGQRILQLKHLPLTQQNIGESWELSAIKGHESIVSNGPLKGKSIVDLTQTYGAELLGLEVAEKHGPRFPLLVKIIDAHHILSLQVHPGDNLALSRHNSPGKSEMWYVIDAKPGAKIYCGTAQPLNPNTLVAQIASGSIMSAIASHNSAPGQFYFIPSGTIHSIGAGNLIVEIQQSSDITYRLFDHNRTDSNGNPRQLHIQDALQAIDFTHPSTVEPTAKTFPASQPNAVTCPQFSVDYIHHPHPKTSTLQHTHHSFNILLVTQGSFTIQASGSTLTLTAGHTALIPAWVSNLTATGTGTLLNSHI